MREIHSVSNHYSRIFNSNQRDLGKSQTILVQQGVYFLKINSKMKYGFGIKNQDTYVREEINTSDFDTQYYDII